MDYDATQRKNKTMAKVGAEILELQNKGSAIKKRGYIKWQSPIKCTF